MSRRSLRVRLLLASTASIAVALALAGFALVELFERHVERRVSAELATFAKQLAGNLQFDAVGTPSLTGNLADPRFSRPLSGLYWQIQEDTTGIRLRSRSLWDYVLPMPKDRLDGGAVHTHELPGPGGEELMVQERPVIYDVAGTPRTMRIAVAVERRSIEQAGREFAAELAPALLVLAVFLSLAAWAQVLVGLRPLEAVRQGVSRIRARHRQRLDDSYPDEIMPLVTEVNDLLAAQEEAMDRARNRAADLAHGLKTPLSVLVGDARRLREQGATDIADELEDLARTMRRHVERELSRARMDAGRLGGRHSADLCEAVRGVVATLKRTPRGEALDWSLDLPESSAVAMEAGDLAEVVGNILENAAKWARSTVRVKVSQDAAAVRLDVRDDGPGVPDDRIGSLGERGVRLDGRIPGSGMGLAIVREILVLYGASIAFGNAVTGGLEVMLTMPHART